MTITRTPDINNPPTYEEIGIEMGGIEMNTIFMLNKRALAKAKALLEEKGFKSTDFFGDEHD